VKRSYFSLSTKSSILTMRWLVVLLLVIMAGYSARGLRCEGANFMLAVAVVALNSLISLMPSKLFERSWFTYILFVLDIAVVSAMIFFSEGINTDFYLVYFLSIFMSSIGRSVKGAFPVAFIASAIYGWLAYRQGGIEMLTLPSFWLRMPFFFLIALFSSFWAGQVQSERRKKEEAERFNQRLEKEIELATEEIRKTGESNKILKEYNENILASISSGVVVVDIEGKVTTFNREASRIFRLPPTVVLDKAISEEPVLSPLKDLLVLTMESGRPQQRREMRATAGDGKELVLGVTTSILHNQTARSNGAIAVLADLTSTRSLEERVRQSEKLAVLGEMAAVMAHEIRNPLNSIAGFAQLLERKGTADPGLMRYVRIIVQEAFRVDSIISDILDFAHRKGSRPTEVNMDELVRRVVSIKDEALRDLRAEVKLEVIRPLPAVRGDPGRLERLLTNLINNAREATGPCGEVKVSAKPGLREKESGVEVSVTDNGCGISPEMAEEIFKPFYTTKSSGTGLGLAIVQKIVEEHRGSMSVNSRQGEGTSFTVFLPAAA